MEEKLTLQQFRRLITHWKESTDGNYKTMLSLYDSKRYDACLFFGHLTLEKSLKIIIMQKTHQMAPRIHNLIRLVELSQIVLSDDEYNILADANEFNMQTRYPEAKYAFYKKCTKAYVDSYYPKIISLYKKLCQKMK